MSNPAREMVKKLENAIIMARVMGYQIEIQYNTIWLWKEELKETMCITHYNDKGVNMYGMASSIEYQKNFSTIEELEKALIEVL